LPSSIRSTNIWLSLLLLSGLGLFWLKGDTLFGFHDDFFVVLGLVFVFFAGYGIKMGRTWGFVGFDKTKQPILFWSMMILYATASILAFFMGFHGPLR